MFIVAPVQGARCLECLTCRACLIPCVGTRICFFCLTEGEMTTKQSRIVFLFSGELCLMCLVLLSVLFLQCVDAFIS